jgi:Rrf2 family protein
VLEDEGLVRVSAKSDYALRTLFHLTELFNGAETKPVSIRLLAERNDIPKRFLEQIMIDLRKCGWVKSVPGRDGGFVLGKPPGEITMGQVVRHFDSILAPIDCVSKLHYKPCSQEGRCRFRRVLLDIRNYAAARMDEATLERVAAGAIVTRKEIGGEEYIDGAGI